MASLSVNKLIHKILALFVGGLFIFSGLIKLNDPQGTAIKLDEYFGVFASDIHPAFAALAPLALFLSIFLSTLEVVLGAALLLAYRKKWVLWLLLAMIVFFTFLTFYSAYFDKVTDCGCFGDAIPLEPWESFYKDVVLLIFILALLALSKFIPEKNSSGRLITIVLVTVACIGLSWGAIRHLPYIDFRAYAIGNHLPTLMQPAAPCRTAYILEKEGKQLTLEDYPTDPGYTLITTKILNEDECIPKIQEFYVVDENGEDFTQKALSGKTLLVIVESTGKAATNYMEQLRATIAAAEQLGAKPMLLTADVTNIDTFRHQHTLALPYYFVDATVLKAMIRATPGVMLLKEGYVLGKFNYRDTPNSEQLQQLLAD